MLTRLFLNPQMLLWAGLIGVPILIYLINRQRYQRRRWAAMEFLLRALKRQRRRIQLQNLLLLLLRIAIILFLVLALARPVHRRGAIAVSSGESQNWVLAIDTSFSMGYRDASLSQLEGAREAILRMLDSLLKPADRISLMTLARRPRILLPPTQLGEDGRQKFLRELDEVELSTQPLDLGASLSTLDELCGKFVTPLGEPEPKRIVVFSDLQKKDWLTRDGSPPAGVAQYLDKIQKEGGEFALAQLDSGRRRPNLALTDLSVTPPLLAKDVWVELRATLRNFSDSDAENVDLTIQVDRDPDDASVEPQTGEVVRVPAGGSLTRVLPYRFTTPGTHTVYAELRSDGLVVDNRRFLAVRVSDSLRVILVDGDPTADPIDRETFHLEVALKPEEDAQREATGRLTPFDPRYVTVDQLSEGDLKDASVVILANVGELTADQLTALESFVRGGGAAIVFLGPNVRSEFYNGRLAGDGLLPGKLDQVRGDPRYPVYLEPVDATHPVVRYFEEHKDVTHLSRPVVAFSRYWQVTLDGGSGSGAAPGGSPPAGASRAGPRLAFRFNDSAGSPAVFDNAYGAGRILWVTSTADQEWNEFSAWPDFVVFLYESVSYLARFGMGSSNLMVGEPFQRRYTGAEYAPEVVLRLPEPLSRALDRTRNVRVAMRSLPGGTDFEILYEDTFLPGLYRLDLLRRGVAGGDSVEAFAVNVDVSESDLRPMTEEDFRASYEGFRYQAFDPAERIREVEGERQLVRGREYWKWILWAVVALVLGETLLSYLFSRRAT